MGELLNWKGANEAISIGRRDAGLLGPAVSCILYSVSEPECGLPCRGQSDTTGVVGRLRSW